MRILQSFPEGRSTTNPYLLQLSEQLSTQAGVLGFSWRRAFTAHYDVFHVHWPEVLIRGRTRARSLARRVLVRALLVVLRLRRVAIVRTLHNVQSHEQASRSEQRLLRQVDRATTLWIRLNPTTPAPAPGAVRTIEHGHYRDWFEPYEIPGPVPGRLLYFGLIRPYKGVADLIGAFRSLPDEAAVGSRHATLDGASPTLHVVGKPSSEDVAGDVLTAAEGDPRVRVTLGHASDGDLAREIGSAELVVLPYREMHNSGAALLALSLGRPILVPDNDVTRALRDEVGADWVLTYNGPLSADILTSGMNRVRPVARSRRPDLSGRDWDAIAVRHLEAYTSALREVRPA